jgi:hypothetical protein
MPCEGPNYAIFSLFLPFHSFLVQIFSGKEKYIFGGRGAFSSSILTHNPKEVYPIFTISAHTILIEDIFLVYFP